MEIRCSQCQHLGAAAEVRPTADGVVLVCEHCGHLNELHATGPAAVSAPIPAADASSERSWVKGTASLERLLPVEGHGPRCLKCAHLLQADEDHCPKCGLSVVEASRFEQGAAPWELPPPGSEAEHEQASLLWKMVIDSPTDENMEKFFAFAREEQLLEYGIQQFRFFLVENPGHERATAYLEELAQSFQSKMIVAQAQAQLRAGSILAKTGQAKGLLLWLVFAVWLGVLAVFLSQMSGPAGC